MELKKYLPGEIPQLKVCGRTTTERNPLTLFWTASRIILNSRSSELWVTLTADYQVYEPWVSILINDVTIQRIMLPKGESRICIYRGLNPETVKKIQVVRDTQAMAGDTDTFLQITEIQTDGEFLPVDSQDLKIEFIGDSITSGEGGIGSAKEEDWVPAWMSAVNNYSYMTSARLNAEYNVISQCGWGFYQSWDGKTECNLPDYYEQVCGLATGKKNQEAGSLQSWDFENWQPDVIVINLGTNDANLFDLQEDNNLTEEQIKQLHDLESAGYNFLKKLRTLNPQAKIIWTYGMVGSQLKPYILNFIKRYKADHAYEMVYFLELEDSEVTGYGARSHPGIKCHERAAKKIAGFIQELLS